MPWASRRSTAVGASFGAGHVEEDEIGVDLGGIDLDPGQPGQSLGQAPGVGVILGKPRDVCVGVDAARRDDARLAHGPAHLLLAPPGLGDEVARAGQGRTDGSAKPLREVDPRRVEWLGERARGDAARHDGVHEAGAVHVRREAVAPPRFDRALDPLERPDAAAAGLLVCSTQSSRSAGNSGRWRPHALVHRRGVELPARAVDGRTLTPASAAGPPVS